MFQNITLKLEKDLLRKAKQLAIQKKTSLSQLMRDSLSKLVNQSTYYDKAKKHALQELQKPRSLGGGPYYSDRSELHERD